MGVVQRPSSGSEQRRSPRHRVKLQVELIEGQRRRTLQTVDVSRHGLFISTDDPPRERYLLQLSIKIPTGPLPATAFVARTAQGRVPGVGVQFFALSAQSKERWDAYIFELSGVAPPPITGDIVKKPDVATFLIKLKDKRRLNEFYEKNVARGGLYMATPVIKEAGAEVGLVVIHPDTEQEYFIPGTVERVCTDHPKGMEIKLDVDRDKKAQFLKFVSTGIGPEVLEPATTDHRKQVDSLPLVTEQQISEDISIDIVVNEDLIEESEQFQWNELSDNSGVLTFDIAVDDDDADTRDTDDLLVPKGTPPPEIDIAPPPKSKTADVKIEAVNPKKPTRDLAPTPTPRGGTLVPRDTARLYELPSETMTVKVSCSACGDEFGAAELGAIGGPLGLLAARHPYWCKYEDRIVSVVRLNSSSERSAAKQHLGDDARRQGVTFALAFEIADLSEPPRCPDCGGDVKNDGIPKAVAQVIDEVRAGASAKLEGAQCPSCREAQLIAERRS
jgi:Tfp pilus assembly protein PilZ